MAASAAPVSGAIVSHSASDVARISLAARVTAINRAKASRCAAPRAGMQFAENHAHGAAKSKTDAGGEGGEGGEGSAAKADADAALDPAVRFYRDIQLVRGHILVGILRRSIPKSSVIGTPSLSAQVK